MTLRELQTEVSALGFDSTVECDAPFLAAANRALRLIYDERCVSGEVRILAVCPPVLKHIDSYVHMSGTIDALPISGRAYSMYVTGAGQITVTTDVCTHTRSFDGKEILIKGFINGVGTMTFSGGGFTVTSLNVYGEIFGTDMEDIPDSSELHFYDVRDRVDNFVSFLSPARNSEGKIIKNATLSDGKLIIHGEYNGEIHLTYRRSPERISDALDREIDVPRELMAHLAILTAAFLWLDDDEEKARYYMELYREFTEKRAIPRELTVSKAGEYVNANGWA